MFSECKKCQMSTVKCQQHVKNVKHIKCQMPAMSNMSKWQMQNICKTSNDKCQMIQMSNVKCQMSSKIHEPTKQKTPYLQIVTISKSIHLTNQKTFIQSLVPHLKFKNLFICICLHVGFKCIWSSIVLLSNARSFLLWSSHIHNYSNSSTAHGYGTSTIALAFLVSKKCFLNVQKCQMSKVKCQKHVKNVIKTWKNT